VVSEPTNGSGVEWSGERANPAALIAAAFPQRLPEAAPERSALERIADALEIMAGMKTGCEGENPENGQPCVLAEGHVGYHVPADGRKPWLDA
jgi:hypothetical protein